MTENELSIIEKRQNRLEDAISKMTDIQNDLNKMLAVHEQRLNQQEKQVSAIEEYIEKRRVESELRIRDIYDTIKTEDKNILDKLTNLDTTTTQQHLKLTNTVIEKTSSLEKIMYTYMGGITVLVFLITHGTNILKFFVK